MIPAAFGYERPADVAEAVSLLALHGSEARVLAGGQSLLPLLKARAIAPKVLIDIGGLAALRGIDVEESTVTIGALVTQAELIASDALRRMFPLLAGDLRPEMVEALKRIKARFRTGCITNNLPANATGSTHGRKFYVDEVMTLFDHVIESARIGLRKPDPRIYRMMVEALKVDPRRCVYLDDLGVNLKPAREMGMTTIKVLNAAQAIGELEAATGLVLR